MPSALAAVIRIELYGPEQALFAESGEQQPRNLRSVIALRPDRRAAVLDGESNFLLLVELP